MLYTTSSEREQSPGRGCPALSHREAFSLSSLRTRARKHRLPPQTNPFFLTMRLHLPKALLAAVLAACLALPSFGGTSTVTSETTTVDGVKYSGYVIEYNGTSSVQFHQATFANSSTSDLGNTLSITSSSGTTASVGAYTDGSSSYSGQSLYYLFANSTNGVNRSYGHTLKLNSSASSDISLHCSFDPITLGGIISTG